MATDNEINEEPGSEELPEVAPEAPAAEVLSSAPASASPEPSASPQPPESGGEEEKTITIPTSQMAKIKLKERDRGRAEGRKEVEAETEARFAHVARVLGFPSVKALEEASPEQWEALEHDMSDEYTNRIDRLEAERNKLIEDKRRLNRARAQEERKRKEVQRQLDAKDAETSLRVAAMQAGVVDIDYALHLLRKDMSGKSQDELAKFDEHRYFGETLKARAPHLYKPVQEPANTAPNAGPAPRPATSPRVTPAAEETAPKPNDAKQMSPAEYREHLKKRGLTDPSMGMPS
jgi:hypothetical protein